MPVPRQFPALAVLAAASAALLPAAADAATPSGTVVAAPMSVLNPDAAAALDDAVAQLDRTMNAVGQPSAEPLPSEGVTALGTALHAILDRLRG